MNALTTSAEGRAKIAQREGNKLVAYQDSAAVWTIGVGHTAAAGAPTPMRGMRISAAESDRVLARDLADVEKTVNSAVKVPLNQNEFDALVSLVFNIGGTNFRKSTVLRMLNKDDRIGAAKSFTMFNKAKDPKSGKRIVVTGLATRRRQEETQFLTGAIRREAETRTPTPAAQLDPVHVELDPAELVPDPLDKDTIAAAQKRLADLGYNPGGADGKIGPLTKGAILAFRNDSGLPLVADIDPALQLALANAKPRQMVPARAGATTQEVAAKVPEVKLTWLTRVGAKIAAYTGGGTTLGLGVLDQIGPAKEKLAPLQDFFDRFPWQVWMGAATIVACVIWYTMHRATHEGVQAFKSGDRR